MAFAVVRFLDEVDSYSEIPVSWISDDKLYCYWPSHKNCGQLMAKGVIPDDSWGCERIGIEGYYDTLEKARKMANDPNYTSHDEERKRCPKPSKWVNINTSDEDENEGIIDEPPQLPIKTKTKIKDKRLTPASQQHTSQHTDQISNVTTYEIRDGLLTQIESEPTVTDLLQTENLQNIPSPEGNNEHSPNLDADEDEVNITIEKMNKLILENNYYLKQIHKRLCNLDSIKKMEPTSTVTEALAKKFPLTSLEQLVEYEKECSSTKDIQGESEHPSQAFILE
ncbi:uncharacterized protein LOC116175963 [Photinus pyralis]|nr:uncharacterized protein LOC116175963 [Photinus pyralis]XP_031350219.1 uncharacterized protein LOC116175963 [Photinus pyralis]XP_031350220.1 uncharacterized protein LOC116175963 [Photinus pyralis]